MRQGLRGIVVAAIIGVCGLAAAQRPGFSVDPGVNGNRPAVRFASPAGPVDILTTFSVLTAETSGVLSARADASTTTAVIELPDVPEDTYVDVAVTTAGSTEPFAWRTLARPAEKPLMQYTGRKEMLPPADFDEYWTRAKKELAAVPMAPKLTRVPDKDTSTGLLYKVELAAVQDTTIVCWYFVPREAVEAGSENIKPGKKFPGIIIAPGYGAEEPPIDRTKNGYITLSVNPRNHGPSRAFWKAPVEHLVYNITDPEGYYYRAAFLDCLRAGQFLFSREEVDAKHVATEGGSQGGLFAIATAALEPRIACVCANVPAFSDYPDSIVLARKEPNAIRELLTDGATTAAQVRKTLSYVDGANMITRVKCPVQINMGDQDPVCPYVTGIVMYNRLPTGVARDFHVAPECKHAVPQVMRDWNASWYKRWLGR